jgi:hypothetical protein
MFTYNNVLGTFISHSDNLSDLNDDDSEDSVSEPEPEMGNHNISSQSSVIDERSQLSKLNKHRELYIYIIKAFLK